MLESTQIRFLLMVRQEADLIKYNQRWSKGEFENNSRKPKDLTENRISDSLKKGPLTLSQTKMKNGDDVADDDDDDAVRTSVSQDQVTLTLYIDELFLRTQFIYCSFLHISDS